MGFFEFPHSRTYDSDLGWLIKAMKEAQEAIDLQNTTINEYNARVEAAEELAAELKLFVENYFDNLDVQQEINNKIDAMAADGSLLELLRTPVETITAETVAEWLQDHITPTSPPVDSSLTVAGAAADAKAAGDAIRNLDMITEFTAHSLGMSIIEWVEGSYIKTGLSVGSSVDLTPIALAGVRHAVVDCEAGDRFTISVVGTSNPRAWAFVDSNDTLLAVSATTTTYVDEEIIAPDGAVKLILNDRPSNGVFDTISIKGTYTDDTTRMLLNLLNNGQNAEIGGSNRLTFEQGAASFSSGVLVPINNNVTVRSKGTVPALMRAGDSVTVDSNHTVYVIQVRQTAAGYARVVDVTNGYESGTANITATGLYFLLVKRADNTRFTPEEAEAAITIAHAGIPAIDRNTPNTRYGGENVLNFEQGSASFTSGVLVPLTQQYTLRSQYLAPVSMQTGDVIHIDSGFTLYVIQVREAADGYVRVQNRTSGYVTGPVRINNDGLYFMLVKNADNTPIVPEDVTVSVQHYSSIVKLPADPYRNVVWDRVQDVTSVSHAHCTEQAQFDTLKAKYDHLAISNYYPSIPYYPLADFFQSTSGVLASPNAEQHGIDGISSKVHMNAVGSFMTSGETYAGTLQEMIADAYAMMQRFCGAGVTLNHPKWSELDKAGVESILSTGGIIAMEIWNATCEGLNGTGYALDLWDQVLADGIQVFGTAVPDHEAQYHPNEDRYPFGYNHMLVGSKNTEKILTAYRQGQFYTTLYNDGLTLTGCTLSGTTLTVEVSEASTFKFVTAKRTVTTTAAAVTGTFTVNADDVYVRAEATRGSNRLFTNAIML